jgi:hypothetical protein
MLNVRQDLTRRAEMTLRVFTAITTGLSVEISARAATPHIITIKASRFFIPTHTAPKHELLSQTYGPSQDAEAPMVLIAFSPPNPIYSINPSGIRLT